VSKGGRGAQKIERSVIAQEDYLQQYIFNNPEALPFYELKADLRLLILAREFSTASGSIDAIGVDADGEIYIVETKLYKNPDKRRVIAQVFDYGAALWGSPEQFLARANEIEWRTRLHDFLGGSEQAVVDHLDVLRRNVIAGQFWFVVLMDKLDDRLRELISFVNANSRFKVLGVELDFYRYGDFEIIIPNLYGAESAKEARIDRAPGSMPSGPWTEDLFLVEAGKLNSDSAAQMRELLDWCKRYGQVRFTPKSLVLTLDAISLHPLFYLYHTDGKLEMNLARFVNEGGAAGRYAENLTRLLCERGFLSEQAIATKQYPRIPINVWGPRLAEFQAMIASLRMPTPE
jgi:hypothetical protein